MKLPSHPEPGRGRAASAAAASARAIHDRLPAFYREERDLLAPFVDAAEDLLAHLEASLESREAAAGTGNPIGLGPGLARPHGSTAAEIRSAFQDRLGVPPMVWNGLEAAAHPAGGLVFRRARRAAVVLAWEKAALSEWPATMRLPRRMLPAGVSLQAVILGRLPRQGGPRIGERFAGDVVYNAAGGNVEVEPL